MQKSITKIIITALAPVIFYECCVLFFYIFVLGTDTMSHVHGVAWKQDIAIGLIVLSVSILIYGLYRKYINPLPEKVEEPYTHPHRSDDWPYDNDLFI